GDGAAVHDLRHLARVRARLAQQPLEPADHRATGVVGGGRDLADPERAVGAAEHQIGERAADVDADPHRAGAAHAERLPRSTVTARPPTRTRAACPPRTMISTCGRPGRPRLSPCSAVNTARPSAAGSAPAPSSHTASGECTEPVTMSSGSP